MDTPATEAYRGIHGAETGRINRLVFSIKYFELENWRGCKSIASSNLTPSAKNYTEPHVLMGFNDFTTRSKCPKQ